jgi:Tol biopolymer transport system component
MWILPIDSQRKPRRWGPDATTFPIPTFSPDGRWLAYQSQETGETGGQYQVKVRPFPGPGPRRTASGPEGGVGPMWSPDGREILFLPVSETDNRVLAMDVAPAPTLRFTNPHVAFALPFAPTFARFFALSPDGRRLVTVRRDPGYLVGIPSLTLIRNWAEEVKAKVGR